MPKIGTNVAAITAWLEAKGFDPEPIKAAGADASQKVVFSCLLQAGVGDRALLDEGLRIAQPAAKVGDQHVGYYLSLARTGKLPGWDPTRPVPGPMATGRKPAADKADKPAKAAKQAEPAKPAGTKLDDADLTMLQVFAKANGIPAGGNATQLRKRIKGVTGNDHLPA